jgi:hypothetical protein
VILARVSGECLRPFVRPSFTLSSIIVYFEILSHQFMVAQPFWAIAHSGRC